MRSAFFKRNKNANGLFGVLSSEITYKILEPLQRQLSKWRYPKSRNYFI